MREASQLCEREICQNWDRASASWNEKKFLILNEELHMLSTPCIPSERRQVPSVSCKDALCALYTAHMIIPSQLMHKAGNNFKQVCSSMKCRTLSKCPACGEVGKSESLVCESRGASSLHMDYTSLLRSSLDPQCGDAGSWSGHQG